MERLESEKTLKALTSNTTTYQWSSLVLEGDEQPDQSHIQTCMENCHAKFFLGFSQTQLLTAWAITDFIFFYLRAP